MRPKRVRNVRRHTHHRFIRETIRDDAKAIYANDLKSYLGMAENDTRHETVNHSAEQWVVGDVHTSSIESVWSLLKRSIVGSFHKVSMNTSTATSRSWGGGSTTATTTTSSPTPCGAS